MDQEADFHIIGELNDFLPAAREKTPLRLHFEDHQSVKHLIEALGIPHTEIGSVRVNGQEKDLAYRPQTGDEVLVYPVETTAQIPPGEPRFVLDTHLGRLAAYLRMLGFDALYPRDADDAELAEIGNREGRILLTRDRRLLMRKIVEYGYCIRSLEPETQLMEVVERYHLARQIMPFRRCLACNAPLETVKKEEILHRLQPLTRRYFDEFRICPVCQRIYWKGSHWERMRSLVQRLQESGEGNQD
jgi:uncharacterized protein with PIN domain